jgi:hypothetical protein
MLNGETDAESGYDFEKTKPIAGLWPEVRSPKL